MFFTACRAETSFLTSDCFLILEVDGYLFSESDADRVLCAAEKLAPTLGLQNERMKTLKKIKLKL